MFRYFASKDDIENNKINITGSDANHLKNILRAEIEDKVAVVTSDSEYVAKIINISETGLLCEILETIENNNEAITSITICQGLPKQAKMETVIQQNVELGVKRFIPLITRRCVVKLNEASRINKKLDRWRKVSHESSKQSRRNIVPEVTEILDLKKLILLAKEENAMILVPYEKDNKTSIKKALSDNVSDNIFIIIGPEGGFDVEEIDYLIDNGAKIVSLGKRILRTQTAGLVAATCVLHERNDMV